MLKRLIDLLITRHLPDDPLRHHHTRTMLVIMYVGLLFISIALFNDALRLNDADFILPNMIGNLAVFFTLLTSISLIIKQRLSAALWLFILVFVATIAVDLATRGADDPGTLLLLIVPVVIAATLLRRRELLLIFILMVTVLLIAVFTLDNAAQRRPIGNFAIVMALIVVLLDQLLSGYRAAINRLEERTTQLQRTLDQHKITQQEMQRLASIVENTTDFIAIADHTGRLIYLNRSGRNLVGIDIENPISTVDVWTFFADWAVESLKGEDASGLFADGLWQGDAVLKIPFAGAVPVSQVIIAQYDADKKIIGVATICRDMRERQEAEGTRLKLALQTERLSALREMVDTVTHDIKSPLSSILTNVYMAQRLASDPARQRDQLDRISEQTRNIETMIHDILTISKMEVAPETTRIPLDLSKLINRIHHNLLTQIQDKNLDLRLEIEDGLSKVSANPGEISRVFTNLLENAIKYTQPSGKIHMRIYEERTTICVAIRDTGIGIPAEDLPHIFDRFYRARNTVTSIQGNGLGLAIVKKIVEGHDGTISIDSKPGEGTLVRVWLPIKIVARNRV